MRCALVIAAALCAFTASANAATGSNGKWCLNEYSAGAEVNCSFQSMAQCNKSKTANSDSCTQNPWATTGSAGMHEKK